MKRLTHAVLVLVAFTLSLTALAADDFYLLRLRVGQEEFRRGQTSEAIEDLKIGCFGLLEQPPLLVEGLAYLALAQAKAGMKAEVDATLIRFAEVEKRFAPFATSGIDTAARLEFTALAKARLSAEVLKGLPGLNPAPPPAPSRDELKAQLEKLVLGKKWPQAAALVPLLEPFGVGDEVSSFYAAISAFEAGDVAKARTLAKPAVGKVMKTPFVEYYEKKILGTP